MNSDKDAEDTSKLIGDYTNIKISKSQGNMELFKSNISKSKEGKKLVTAQDLKNQDSSDILILVKGFFKIPIKAKVPYWFLIKEWKGADDIEITQTKEEEPQEAIETNNEPTKGEENVSTQNEDKPLNKIDEKKAQRDELLKALKIKVERD